MSKRRYLLFCIISCLAAFIAAPVFAKTLNLHLEPKPDSKVTGSVDTQAGVTIVYAPKGSEWIKIANPTNGDVGWVKSSDLSANGYNMRIITSDDGTHSYSIYQFGAGGSQYDQKQLEIRMQEFERQRKQIQGNMARMLNEMLYFSQPLFVPVVLVPEVSERPQKLPEAKSTKPPQRESPTQDKKK